MKKLKRFFVGPRLAEIYNRYIDKQSCNSLDMISMIAYRWVEEFLLYYSTDYPIVLLSGRGYKKKLTFAIQKKLQELGFKVDLVQINIKNDTDILSFSSCLFHPINHDEESDFQTIYIDGLWDVEIDGYGDTKEGKFIEWLNKSQRRVVSVDIPSGMSTKEKDVTEIEQIVKAERTITTLFPRLALLFRENGCYTGIWNFVEIPSLEDSFESEETKWFYVTDESVRASLPVISRFSHKGDNGYALLIAGSYGMMGAAQLCAQAALNSGVGVLTVHVPQCGVEIMQITTPQAIVSIDRSKKEFTTIDFARPYRVLGVGPGIGQSEYVRTAIQQLLLQYDQSMIIDADGINVIAADDKMKVYLNKNKLLTPHPIEFDRLVGKSINSFERLTKLCNFVAKYETNVLLKGAYSVVATADGRCCFHLGGTPAMAKGGSGDVLTGIILALAAQGLSLEDAAIIGMYVHAKAGEHAQEIYGCRGVNALDICHSIKHIWKNMED